MTRTVAVALALLTLLVVLTPRVATPRGAQNPAAGDGSVSMPLRSPGYEPFRGLVGSAQPDNGEPSGDPLPPQPLGPRRVQASVVPVKPTATPKVAPRATPRPTAALGRSVAGVRRTVAGVASFYCVPGRSICTVGFPASGAYAAAGVSLRHAMGNWRGRTVTVCTPDCITPRATATVRLIDCLCSGSNVIDLYGRIFAQLAPGGLAQGLLRVEVSWT